MGFKSPKLVILNFYAEMPRRFILDTTYIHMYVKQLANNTNKCFIHVDIAVLVSEFVVVAILSEWPLPTAAGTSLTFEIVLLILIALHVCSVKVNVRILLLFIYILYQKVWLVLMMLKWIT